MNDADDGHAMASVVDPVDHAIGAAAGAVSIVERWPQPLANALRVVQQRSHDELVIADVTQPDQAERMVADAVDAFGGLHIAFNAAGVLGTPGPLAELGDEAFAAVWANPTGTWLSMKYKIAHMRAHGGGAIVNMASVIGAHMTLPAMGAYAASKAAVSILSRTAAQEHIGDGIRINVLSPGPVDTWMSRLPGESDTDRDERMKESLPIGRVATTDEIADAVLWLSSPQSGFAVGLDLVLDGGATA